ncbi:TPA: DNA-processing protein DprA [Vibrio cholerae]|uniref:DNA-processing protein DprA n=1 Tax=Vibrio cholerae TaxID=666 RepID=UPI0028DAC451|nr:DNA-protecting protein DprA [Vibrio cholerae]EHD2270664.1 DNA-protecting protein DprA [Vibrio cholerae]EIJ2220600.1 DNA-protecting protein DprA [Vibrio cholerae]EJL6997948.1 DNA-protecting protein DprA [Vibrio cholerae]EKF9882052.1 DNA-protecting protein DprA [Vibrio cholerae]
MKDQDLAAWLALCFTPKLGSKTISHLLATRLPAQLQSFTPKQWLASGLKPEQLVFLTTQAAKQAELCLQWRSAANNRYIVTPHCPLYPRLLKEINSSPPILFIEGIWEAVHDPAVAIVGSRNASVDGRQIARQFATELAQSGLVVTSGLALGIDGYAHDGALQAQGQTVAVLGSGLAQVYPKQHQGLAERIIAQGALVSEFAPHTPPKADHFPRRNRIISGLSLGVVVVEAAEKSGSLITARYAAEQGREVFVVPGSIFNAASQGSNQLIRQGACLVQSVQQIHQELKNALTWSLSEQVPYQATLFSAVQGDEELPFPELLANVGIEATPIDILASRTQIPVQDIMMQLLELELLGHVVAVPGGYIRKGRG